MMTANSANSVVRVDFHNADTDGFVRLNTVGTINDLASTGIVLRDGVELLVTDGEVEVTGIVRRPGTEGVWRLQIDWSALSKL